MRERPGCRLCRLARSVPVARPRLVLAAIGAQLMLLAASVWLGWERLGFDVRYLTVLHLVNATGPVCLLLVHHWGGRRVVALSALLLLAALPWRVLAFYACALVSSGARCFSG